MFHVYLHPKANRVPSERARNVLRVRLASRRFTPYADAIISLQNNFVVESSCTTTPGRTLLHTTRYLLLLLVVRTHARRPTLDTNSAGTTLGLQIADAKKE